MFEGLKDMGRLMSQAKEMRSKMKDVQKKLKTLLFKGTDKSGKIEVVVTGELECTSVSIDPSFLGESNKKALEAGLREAINIATKDAKTAATSQLSDISQGLNIPGLE